jgi:hypothetical protein
LQALDARVRAHALELMSMDWQLPALLEFAADGHDRAMGAPCEALAEAP